MENYIEELEKLKKENELLKKLLKENNIQFNQKEKSIVKTEEIATKESVTTDDKVDLYLSYFKGRTDVCATLYTSSNGTTGLSSKCSNRFTRLCNLKAHPRCRNCLAKSYKGLNKKDVLSHFKGEQVYAIYPINKNDESNFFCVEFKESDQHYVKEFKNICNNNNFDTLITNTKESTYLVWGFFLENTKAIEVRRIVDELLKILITKTYYSDLSIFDRIMPNQNYQPKDSLGSAVILPISGKYIKDNKTIFLDNDLNKVDNPSNFLSTINKITKDNIINFLSNKKNSNILLHHSLIDVMFDQSELSIDYTNDIIFKKSELSSKLFLKLCLIATTQNREFLEKQKKKLSVYSSDRNIFLFNEDEEYLYIPRGCYKEVFSTLSKNNILHTFIDTRNIGTPIMFSMYTQLYDSQVKALNELVKYDNGLLVAPPAFGKTILALGLIERLEISCAILVDKTSLIDQWKSRIVEHSSIITVGEYHGKKKSLTGIVDVLSFQSLKDNTHLLDQYGLIIVDEVHHVAAKTLQSVIRSAKSKYVYGLTATPKRSDGNENIIYLTIGDIRYSDDTKENHTFTKTLIPRFTTFSCPNKTEYVNQINMLVSSEERNHMIVEDVEKEFINNKKILILTDRLEHTELLYNNLKHLTDKIVVATGALSKKEKEQFLEKLTNFKEEPFILIATGKFIGEGFDEKRLDVLFITTPFKWSGTLSQYVGRLHRTDGTKESVTVYDYIDYKTSTLLNMFSKRLEGYKLMDYIIKKEEDIQKVLEDNNSIL